MVKNIIPELNESELKRFWDKVDVTPDIDECWLWNSALSGKMGYRFFSLRNINYNANRIVLWLKTGLQGEIARHSCDTPACCNPKHLDWGTTQQNVDDRMKRGRHVVGNIKGILHPLSKLDEESVFVIRSFYNKNEYSAKQLSKLFNVGLSTIYDVVRNVTWTHLLNLENK